MGRKNGGGYTRRSALQWERLLSGRRGAGSARECSVSDGACRIRRSTTGNADSVRRSMVSSARPGSSSWQSSRGRRCSGRWSSLFRRGWCYGFADADVVCGIASSGVAVPAPNRHAPFFRWAFRDGQTRAWRGAYQRRSLCLCQSTQDPDESVVLRAQRLLRVEQTPRARAVPGALGGIDTGSVRRIAHPV